MTEHMIHGLPIESEKEKIVQTVNLTKNYFTLAGIVPALHNVNFSLTHGEFVAVMGPSGSGKSTFMNIIGGLDKPTSGYCSLFGQIVKNLSSDEMARIRNRLLGFVFQGFNLLPRMNLLNNVALPLLYSGIPDKERLCKAKKMLKKVGLGQYLHHRPNQVSGGQQQRAAIARALVSNPSLILADEPTGNLDSQTTEEILKLLCQLNDDGLSIVLVTHESEVANYAKRLIYFKDGLLVNDKQVDLRRWVKPSKDL